MNRRSEIDTIPDVLSFFAVGGAHEITPIKNGIANHNYAVSTDRGDYVIKFLVNQTTDDVENDVSIQRQLRQAGVGAPQYVRSGDGGYLYRGRGAISAVISEKIDGVTPRRMSVELTSDIGRHLALFHTSVAALPHPNNAGLMNPGVSGVDSEWARRLFDQPLPRGIIHGDLHGGNVLVHPRDRDRVTAILDFEEAGENLLLVDLAVTLMGVSASTSREAVLKPELMRAVKRGYEAVRTLTDEEHPWLPQAIRYASEAWIDWFRANGFDGYARQHQRRYESFLEVVGDRLAL